MMPKQMSPDDCRQLAAVYELLSQLWSEEIGIELLNALNSDDLRASYEKLGGRLPAAINEYTVDELAVDYCQLLIGPQNQISPIQSVWQSQTLQSEAASSMQWYFGLLPNFEARCNIPDHFGVQLQFMSELLLATANKSDDSIAEIAEEFFTRHLVWTKPFLKAVAEQAKTDFYVGLAKLTSNFLHAKN